MTSAFLFIYGILSVLMAVNALRPPSPPTSRFPPLWFPAVLVAEAPWLWLLIRAVVTGLLVWQGALQQSMGRIGLGLVLVSLVLQIELIRRSRVAARLLSSTLSREPWWVRLTGWPYRLPHGVQRDSGIEYSPGLTLDLYRLREAPGKAPCLIYVHGGSWGGGDPRLQFRPITHHLAAQGWIVATIRYPRSPVATFPDHLIEVKRSLVWARNAGTEFGIDPDRIAIAGGSAGAHLAALTALTPGRNQPGFEDADATVRAAVTLYGIYDFFNRHKVRYDWPVIPVRVMKASPEEAPERYREASPIDQANGGAPPFLIVHGTHDSLVPPGEGIFFAEALMRAGSEAEMVPVLWGQHAFDIMSGVRSRALAVKISEFLESRM